jgi:L-fuconolactonase
MTSDHAGTPRTAIVDSHHHVWDLAVRPQPWLDSHPDLAPLRRKFSMADLAPLADAAGVTASVVIQTMPGPGETPEMLALAASDPLVAAVVGWTDLTAPDIADVLAGLLALPHGERLAGIRHPALIEPEVDWHDQPEVRRGMAALGAAGLSYDVVGRQEQFPSAARAAAAVPDTLFVLDHFGNVEVEPVMDAAWLAAFLEFGALPNTVAKLSGILSVPAPDGPAAGRGNGDGPPPVAHLRPYADLMLESFGPDRMMFGSDWPVSTIGAPYSRVVATARALISELSPAEQEQIMSGTARRVYRLA